MEVQNETYTDVICDTSPQQKYVINPFAAVPSITLGQFICSHCYLTFDKLLQYEQHISEKHTEDRSRTCTLCNAKFTRRDHLKRHIQSVHNNQHFFKCPLCAVNYTRQDILTKHIMEKHSEGKQLFQCRECAFACETLMDLANHEFAHIMPDRHICIHCKTTFKRRDHMLRHVKSQHSNEFYECPLCYLMYKRKDHLVRHLREKHEQNNLNQTLVPTHKQKQTSKTVKSKNNK